MMYMNSSHIWLKNWRHVLGEGWVEFRKSQHWQRWTAIVVGASTVCVSNIYWSFSKQLYSLIFNWLPTFKWILDSGSWVRQEFTSSLRKKVITIQSRIYPCLHPKSYKSSIIVYYLWSHATIYKALNYLNNMLLFFKTTAFDTDTFLANVILLCIFRNRFFPVYLAGKNLTIIVEGQRPTEHWEQKNS